MTAKKKSPTILDRVTGDQVFQLAKIGCTLKEIGDTFKVSPASLLRLFKEDIDRGQADLNMCIRRKQLKVALEDENVPMLIHLGKTMLKQNDQITVTHEVTELDALPTDQLIEIVKANQDKLTH